MLRSLTILVLIGLSIQVYATEYRCKVEKELSYEKIYSLSEIESSQFSVLVEEKTGSVNGIDKMFH